MNVDQLADFLKSSKKFMSNVTHWEELPAKEAEYDDFPDKINKTLINSLSQIGISQLYSHQVEAISHTLNGENTVVVTPTASGKTLCYNIPVINEIILNPECRALYIFPTKALAQDQLSELNDLIASIETKIQCHTYDGDTPSNTRRTIRQSANVIITNPDMLHSSILPNHTGWSKFFENLKYIIIDELHTYVGVFGSHFSNIIRRLKRICAFYNSNPQFICLSATIANPKELAEQIISQPVFLIDRNGAPAGKKHIVFYNPPIVNKHLAIRANATDEVKKIIHTLVENTIQSIVFFRSRIGVEVMLKSLQETLKSSNSKHNIMSYRGGYLPLERREIEKKLRNGEIDCVISTNALELGIDIGALDACITCGYPGSISSSWQQFGRSGRRMETSIVFMIATSRPIDQYIINHSEYFFDTSPEYGQVNPDNFIIFLDHIECASYEIPFKDGEFFGDTNISEYLEHLEENGMVRHIGGKWHWMGESAPSSSINIRGISSDNFIIIDISDKYNIIGEMDRHTVPTLLHEQAIYMHKGEQYHVEKLDFNGCKAYVRKVNVNYYTDADSSVELKVLDVVKTDHKSITSRFLGEVMVTSQTTMFKKIKFNIHENIGYGKVFLPAFEMFTSAYWFAVSPKIADGMSQNDFNEAMLALSNIISNIAPVSLMCSSSDIHVWFHARSPFTSLPTIYIYDNCPGGIGLSEKIYDIQDELFSMALDHIRMCECENGCPSCIGPNSSGKRTKDNAVSILERIIYDIQS